MRIFTKIARFDTVFSLYCPLLFYMSALVVFLLCIAPTWKSVIIQKCLIWLVIHHPGVVVLIRGRAVVVIPFIFLTESTAEQKRRIITRKITNTDTSFISTVWPENASWKHTFWANVVSTLSWRLNVGSTLSKVTFKKNENDATINYCLWLQEIADYHYQWKKRSFTNPTTRCRSEIGSSRCQM